MQVVVMGTRLVAFFLMLGTSLWYYSGGIPGETPDVRHEAADDCGKSRRSI